MIISFILSHHPYRAAGVVALLMHLNLDGDAVAQFLDVADDADVTVAACVQGAQRVDGILQRFAAEGAKALVDEEGIDRQILTYVAQCQCQREGHQEALTARNGARRAGSVKC